MIQVWAYFVQIVGAIAHMHEQRMMHRDIKPANIFISGSNVLKMGDLGLGRVFSTESVEAFSKVAFRQTCVGVGLGVGGCVCTCV